MVGKKSVNKKLCRSLKFTFPENSIGAVFNFSLLNTVFVQA